MHSVKWGAFFITICLPRLKLNKFQYVESFRSLFIKTKDENYE